MLRNLYPFCSGSRFEFGIQARRGSPTEYAFSVWLQVNNENFTALVLFADTWEENEEQSKWRLFESEHTQTLYYLAQVR